MPTPPHIRIINRIPCYHECTRKTSKRQIQECMREYEFDEDYIEQIDDRFCQGFGAARDLIVEMLKKQYWDEHANEHTEQKTEKAAPAEKPVPALRGIAGKPADSILMDGAFWDEGVFPKNEYLDENGNVPEWFQKYEASMGERRIMVWARSQEEAMLIAESVTLQEKALLRRAFPSK